MATIPTIFLESTTHGAKEHNIEAIPLPENKGLLLFAQGTTVPEQCALLKNMIEELQRTQTSAAPHDNQKENGQSQEPSIIDCQVTVEERAQLFKFLNG